jgi:hypothetical protein
MHRWECFSLVKEQFGKEKEKPSQKLERGGMKTRR